MIDEPRARELAIGAFEAESVVLGSARELNDGWFFPSVTKEAGYFTGVIVNKNTGRSLRGEDAFTHGQRPTLYDRGYQYDSYDLVVLAIADLEQTAQVIDVAHVVTVDTYYKNDRVSRVGRPLTETEVRKRLSHLPCAFSGWFSFRIDELERARDAR